MCSADVPQHDEEGNPYWLNEAGQRLDHDPNVSPDALDLSLLHLSSLLYPSWSQANDLHNVNTLKKQFCIERFCNCSLLITGAFLWQITTDSFDIHTAGSLCKPCNQK